MPARLAAIATAVPPYALNQDDVARRVQVQFSDSAVVERLMPVFANAGIDRRYSAVPIDWYYEPHGWRDRNEAYVSVALDLLERAALDALAKCERRIEDVDAIVVVSTTGLATPSLDAQLMERLPFKRTVRRLPIFGLGCVGGALGLARAAAMADAMPGSLVLLLVVELCALSFRRDEVTKSNIVATALFGDGAAAAVIGTTQTGPAIAASGEYTFPRSLDVMGWDVADDGMRAIFSRDIPSLIANGLRPAVDAFLAEQGANVAQLDRVLAHPGGTKVLEALESAFELEPGTMHDSREVLREYGNMSSATLLFVLHRAMERGALRSDDWALALCSAMGPGFTAGFLLLQR